MVMQDTVNLTTSKGCFSHYPLKIDKKTIPTEFSQFPTNMLTYEQAHLIVLGRKREEDRILITIFTLTN